jgi:hypothetical protein
MDQARNSHSNQGFVSKRYKKRLIMEWIYQSIANTILEQFQLQSFLKWLDSQLQLLYSIGVRRTQEVRYPYLRTYSNKGANTLKWKL